MNDEGELRSGNIKETQKEFLWIEVKLEIRESER